MALMLTIAVLSACGGQKGGSLSEYAAKSESYKNILFEDYVISLFSETPQRALEMQDSTLKAAARDSAALGEMLSLQRNFLYDVNSPYRCEDFYIPVMEAIIGSPYTSSAEKAEAASDLPLFKMNPLGTPAADFTFTVKGGRTKTLYSLRADYTLLFFSNPGCQNCKEITDRLSAIGAIDALMADGTLAIVNIYPDDDIEAWYDYVAEYPSAWTSGYAPEVDDPGEGVYNLRAIPTLYLLDREKRVIQKDAPLERILSYLENAIHS